MKIFVVFLLFLFLGCTSSPPPRWENPDKTDKDSKSPEADDSTEKKGDLRDDYQLYEALNLLKGVNIVKQAK